MATDVFRGHGNFPVSGSGFWDAIRFFADCQELKHVENDIQENHKQQIPSNDSFRVCLKWHCDDWIDLSSTKDVWSSKQKNEMLKYDTSRVSQPGWLSSQPIQQWKMRQQHSHCPVHNGLSNKTYNTILPSSTFHCKVTRSKHLH